VGVYDNVMSKKREHEALANGLIQHVIEYERAEVRGMAKQIEAEKTDRAEGDGWTLDLGDCVDSIKAVDDDSVALSVFSPPFATLYTYTDSDRDMGNSRNYEEFFSHFGYLLPELLRVTMPCRRACVHVTQLGLTKVNDGVIGLRDFRADTVRAFVAAGWIYDGEVCIDKDPQAQAIRTKSKALTFSQKNKDSAWSRPALADYILLFRVPGENAVPVETDVTNEEWIKWARPIWYNIRETETLNVVEARSEKDERHICPLQLETIRRCLRLWSNKGDLVLDPFAGIGSTGYEAIRLGRTFHGFELKPEYYRCAIGNLQEAERNRVGLFD
jgi:DNA modification methylase